MTVRDLLRFISHADRSDGCWLWTAATDRDGYGKFKIHGHQVFAHRWAYEHFVGPIGDLLVCHHCDTPGCVRPDHLFLGTAADNTADMIAKGRHVHGDEHWAHRHPERLAGERNPATRLTEDDVRRIRRNYADGATQAALAAEFGVSQPLVSQIVRRRVWAHLTEEVAA